MIIIAIQDDALTWSHNGSHGCIRDCPLDQPTISMFLSGPSLISITDVPYWCRPILDWIVAAHPTKRSRQKAGTVRAHGNVESDLNHMTGTWMCNPTARKWSLVTSHGF